ncbi:unnamed protein product [Periconia digitata]|uniref:Uncharacterized protein n=1 Tax=Periconia digitata TaxID=1303443 RepID=A0A9W4UKY1_9PLEO|nr:unnamed protein product [Periconia digitata]
MIVEWAPFTSPPFRVKNPPPFLPTPPPLHPLHCTSTHGNTHATQQHDHPAAAIMDLPAQANDDAQLAADTATRQQLIGQRDDLERRLAKLARFLEVQYSYGFVIRDLQIITDLMTETYESVKNLRGEIRRLSRR